MIDPSDDAALGRLFRKMLAEAQYAYIGDRYVIIDLHVDVTEEEATALQSIVYIPDSSI